MDMIATVVRVDARSMLVIDSRTGTEVRVFSANPNRFRPGNLVIITFSGAMTKSIPPQITATSIQLISAPTQPTPSEIMGTIIQKRRTSLLISDMDGRRVLVRYRFSYHFCIGQRVIVRYKRIVMNNPIEVTATDITPMC